AHIAPAEVCRAYAAAPGTLPPDLESGLARLKDIYIRGNTVRLDAISPYKPSEPAATAIVSRVRAIALDPGVTRMQVGGAAAVGEDFLISQSNRTPWAV